MPETSQDFVDALREGHYLKAIKFSNYVPSKYQGSNDSDGSADMLLPLCTYELLSTDFSIQDIVHIQVFYGFLDFNIITSPTKVLSGDQQYAMMNLFSVLQMALIAKTKEIEVNANTPLSCKEIDALFEQYHDVDDEELREENLETIKATQLKPLDKEKLTEKINTTKHTFLLDTLRSRVLKYYKVLNDSVSSQFYPAKAAKLFLRNRLFSTDDEYSYREARCALIQTLSNYLHTGIDRLNLDVIKQTQLLLVQTKEYYPSKSECTQIASIEKLLTVLEKILATKYLDDSSEQAPLTLTSIDSP